MIDFVQALQELNQKAFDAWKASCLTIFASNLAANARFAGVEVADQPPPSDQFWSRTSVQVVDQGRATLGAIDGNSRRYETIGFVWIQLFAPKSSADNYWTLLRLGNEIRGKFLGVATPGGVRFKNARVDNRAQNEAQWLRIDFWVEFDFDERRTNGA